MQSTSLFSCVGCKEVLALGEETASCSQCAATFPLVGAAPDLLAGDMDTQFDGQQERAVETDFVPHRKRKGPISEHLGRQWIRVIGDTLRELRWSLDRPVDLLDVGCGTKLDPRRGSWYPDLLVPVAGTYLGVDPSAHCAEVASRSDANLSRFQTAEIARAAGEQLPLPEASVDVVLMISVLDHCAEPAQTLRECHRVLRPGGLLLVLSGLRYNWVHQLARRLLPRTTRRRDEADHHRHFTISELRELVTSTCFEGRQVRESGYVGLPPQGRRIEAVVAKIGSAAGRDRFLRAMEHLDDWSARRFPGYGSRVLITASCGY